VPINDTEALQGFRDLTKIEGIIPALESSHAILTSRPFLRHQYVQLSLNLYHHDLKQSQ
jgi:tryptophan synthase beta subunit